MASHPEAPEPATEQELRRIVPEPGALVARKIQRRFDPHAERLVGLSPFVAIALQRADGRIEIGARAGAPGFVSIASPTSLVVPDTFHGRIGTALADAASDAPVGLLFVVPGIGETLRVNGRARWVAEPAPALHVEIGELFLHCPKAFLRSRLWRDSATRPARDESEPLSYLVRSVTLDPPLRAWLARSPFALLGSADACGRADVSPRGDPAGFLRVLDERTLLLPDRPGNRLLDSFRNVLAQPTVALLALIPGEPGALRVLGTARVTRDPELLAASTLGERRAQLGLLIDVREATLEMRHEAFASARLWDAGARVPRRSLPTLGRMLVEQTGARGLRGAIAARALDTALRRDERNNL